MQFPLTATRSISFRDSTGLISHFPVQFPLTATRSSHFPFAVRLDDLISHFPFQCNFHWPRLDYRSHRAVDGEGLREGAKPEVAEAVCRWPCGRRRDGASGWGNCFRCSCGHIMKLSWDPVGNWELTICSIVDIVGPKWELGI